MSFMKLLKGLALSMAVASSAAFAGCVDSPYFAYLAGGIDFDLIDIDQTTTIIPVPGYTVTGQTTSMSLDGLNGYFSLGAGATSTELGIGGSVNVQFGNFDTEGAGNVLSSDAWGLFVNLDLRTLSSSSHNADSNVGAFFSAGIGFLNFVNVEGKHLIYLTSIGASATDTATFTYSEGNTFAIAGQVKGGIDMLIGDSLVATLSIGALFTFTDVDVDDVSYVVNPTSIGTGTSAIGIVLDEFEIPSFAVVTGELRISKFFGSSM